MPSAVGTTYNFHSGFKNVFMKTFMYGVVGSLAMFISSWEKADRLKDQFIDKSRDYGDTFDFIVGKKLGKRQAHALERKDE